MTKYSGFILKIIKQIENNFDCIAYGYIDDSNNFWHICVSNYDIYISIEFKDFCKKHYITSIKRGVRILFCFCNPIENKLKYLSDNYNLVMNV